MKVVSIIAITSLSIACVWCDTTLQDYLDYQQVALLTLTVQELQNLTLALTTGHPELGQAGTTAANAVFSCAELRSSSPSRFYYITTPWTEPRYMYCEINRNFRGILGNWLRVAKLNMRDPSQNCPSGFATESPTDETARRLCTRTGPKCTSHYFPVYGYQYQTVCGKIIAYQKGRPDAFFPYFSDINALKTIDDVYVDGVSLTHSSQPRQHIWTFAAALHEIASTGRHLCPCTNSNNGQNNFIRIPDFVDENYFCDTGSREEAVLRFYGSNPLWDGRECGPNDSCCSRQNNQAYFCTTLPSPTTNPIEMRICADQIYDEQIYVEEIELYVK